LLVASLNNTIGISYDFHILSLDTSQFDNESANIKPSVRPDRSPAAHSPSITSTTSDAVSHHVSVDISLDLVVMHLLRLPRLYGSSRLDSSWLNDGSVDTVLTEPLCPSSTATHAVLVTAACSLAPAHTQHASHSSMHSSAAPQLQAQQLGAAPQLHSSAAQQLSS